MHRFLIGVALSFMAFTAYVGWRYRETVEMYWYGGSFIALLLILTPLVSAWPAVALIHFRCPRRWLLSRGPGRTSAVLMGVGAGVFALVLTIPAMVANYVERILEGEKVYYELNFYAGRLPEFVLVAGCVFLSALLFTWLMPRYRPGSCSACGYDVHRSLDFGRCPECGQPVSA